MGRSIIHSPAYYTTTRSLKWRLRARSAGVLRARPPASSSSPTAATAATRASAPPAQPPALFRDPSAAGEMRSLWARTKIARVSLRPGPGHRECSAILTGIPGSAIRGLCSKHAVDAFPPASPGKSPRKGVVGRFSAGGAGIADHAVAHAEPASRPAPARFCPPG